ncbi:signal transduction histidine kinase [Streptacidiphilus sp. MAP12-20]|uniref:sensor histidine kinase n=1 Tax=Streptacidiphilus sp. MAP12-20 TaxID=3156299 RepID=UPI003518D44A
MITDIRENWTWREQAREALRPDPPAAPLSTRATVLDAAFAVALMVAALIVAATHPLGFQAVDLHGQHLDPSGVAGGAPPAPVAEPHAVVAVYEPWYRAVLSTLPLALRRRYPLGTFWVVIVASESVHTGATWVNLLACVIAAYSAVTYSRYRVQATASLVLGATAVAIAFRHADPMLPGWSGPFVVMLLAGGLSSISRTWRQRLTDSQERLAELQSAQEDAMRRALEEERSRIASELHDVVTHNVSVMVILAGAARTVLDKAPEEAKRSLLAVESGGRAAMAELRHVMGLLAASSGARPDGEGGTVGSGDELEPQPGLDQLGGLVERVRAAGVDVTVDIADLPPDPLPSGLDLAVYRVVQEALTNTMKHAAGARATVSIGRDGAWLRIEVADGGGLRSPQAATGNGRGLLGMRERLAVYGGTLESGRRIGGGYKITARVPWKTD